MLNAVLYAATILSWGLTWYAVKLQIGVVPPEWSLVYRFGAAGLLLLAWIAWRAGRAGGPTARLPWRRHAALALLAAFIFCGNYLMFYWAAHFIASGLLAVVFATATVFNAINGALFLRQPIRPATLAAAALGLGGLALVFLPELRTVGGDSLIGLGLALAATFCFSLGNVLSSRSQTAGVPVMTANAYAMTYGAMLTALYAAAIGSGPALDLRPSYLWALAYLVVFGNIVGFGAYLTLLGRIGAARAAYATVLIPVIALAVSAMLEDYRWTWLAGVGVALVIAGNVVALRGGRAPQPAAAGRPDRRPVGGGPIGSDR
ncbi:MAG: DMT family transporter [Alphaproteobacteria bacterium]